RSATAGLRIKPRKVPRAHMYTLCKRLDPEVAFQMFLNPLFQFAEHVRIRLRLCGKQGAVLRLAAGPFEINDKHARRIHRDFPPSILLDECEGEVDSGSHSCGTPYASVSNENGVRLHRNGWVAAGQQGRVHPVRRRPASVEKSRLG